MIIFARMARLYVADPYYIDAFTCTQTWCRVLRIDDVYLLIGLGIRDRRINSNQCIHYDLSSLNIFFFNGYSCSVWKGNA